MNHHSVCDIIAELESTNSRLEKEAILIRNKDNKDLKRVFYLAYNPQINFFIKKIPGFFLRSEEIELMDAVETLVEKLSARQITGNAARDFLSDILSRMLPSEAEILTRVVGKDMKCGVTATTLNKIWPSFIPVMEMSLAESDYSKIKIPAIVQSKADGLRAHFTRRKTDLLIQTRNGNVIYDDGIFYESAKDLTEIGDIWDGEIVCVDQNGNYLKRKQSNGILNKAIAGTISESEIVQMRSLLWDIPTVKEPYRKRFSILRNLIGEEYEFSTKFRLIPSWEVNSFEEINYYYDLEIKAGREGLVVKDPNALWEGKRTSSMIKLKEIIDCDLRVIGWEEGTGRNKGRMGNLIVATDCGRLKTAVGTGFSDKQRDKITEENSMGRILALQYNEIIKPKDSDIYSLFLPRAIEFRDDKDEPDPFESFIR
jgi:ATP-dependent DNA ligase